MLIYTYFFVSYILLVPTWLAYPTAPGPPADMDALLRCTNAGRLRSTSLLFPRPIQFLPHGGPWLLLQCHDLHLDQFWKNLMLPDFTLMLEDVDTPLICNVLVSKIM